MFLGEALLKISSIASLTNFLSLVLHPRPVDPPGIFETPISNIYDYIVGKFVIRDFLYIRFV